jgi:hypothetical protein
MEPAEVAHNVIRRRELSSEAWQLHFQHLERRLASLHLEREGWRSYWSELARYILPRRYRWLTGADTRKTPNHRNTAIVDSTGTIAMRTCANGLLSNLCSPSKPWFKLKLSEDADDIPIELAQWLESVEKVVYGYLSGSNFYNSAKQVFEDISTFGTSVMIIYDDPNAKITCYVPCAGEYYLLNSSKYQVEGLYRKFPLSVSQIVGMFGLENCPAEIQRFWSEKGQSLQNQFTICHAIEPNIALPGIQENNGRIINKGFDYKEVYWLSGKTTPAPLSIRGFYEAPFFAPRWSTGGNDAYGESVSMDVLPDIKQLQQMVLREAEAIDKLVRPPLIASVEMKNEPSSILPGHVTYAANIGPQSGMRPIYEVRPDLAAMDAKIQQVQSRIKVGFHNDLFQMLGTMQGIQPRNMLELQERKAEKMAIMGPVVDLWQREFASPVILRIISIAARRGELPPVPEEAAEYFGEIPWPLPVEYINEFAILQRGASTVPMERVMQMAGNIAGAKPEVLDNLDEDAFIIEYSDRMTAPKSIIRQRKAVEQIRMQRQQQIEQAKQMEMMTQAAGVLPKAAETLSNTHVGGGKSALETMLGYAGDEE